MTRSTLWLVAVLLAGCQPLQPVPVDDLPVCEAVDPEPDPATTWLLRRSELCSLEGEVQRARLAELQGHDEATAIERVLLTSCDPARTPGLMREALNALPDNPDRDPALQSLLNMLRDHTRSYRMLEDRNSQLAEQLEATVEGIRQIEADMESLRRNRRNH